VKLLGTETAVSAAQPFDGGRSVEGVTVVGATTFLGGGATGATGATPTAKSTTHGAQSESGASDSKMPRYTWDLTEGGAR
jgi:hypothetical protein